MWCDIDELTQKYYIGAMKNAALASVIILSTLSLGGVSYACDMHGGGFGAFGLGNANWQTFNPRASKFDPTYEIQEKELVSPFDKKTATIEKARPSFSNAANMAALRAKARLAKKSKDDVAEKSGEEAIVKKASLDTDR